MRLNNDVLRHGHAPVCVKLLKLVNLVQLVKLVSLAVVAITVVENDSDTIVHGNPTCGSKD